MHIARLPFAAAVVLLFVAAPAAATICGAEWTELDRVQGLVVENARDRGFLLPGVRLTLSREGGSYERQQISDDEGFFAFPTVPAGDYTLVAELEGFTVLEARIRVRRNANLDQVLVVTLVTTIDECPYLALKSARKARRLQKRWSRGSP